MTEVFNLMKKGGTWVTDLLENWYLWNYEMEPMFLVLHIYEITFVYKWSFIQKTIKQEDGKKYKNQYNMKKCFTQWKVPF